jgi:hypothetical protein
MTKDSMYGIDMSVTGERKRISIPGGEKCRPKKGIQYLTQLDTCNLYSGILKPL